MDPRTLEHDLLDLIEGRLAPERREAVRAALRADPELLRQVEGMIRDRQGIGALVRESEQAARADVAGARERVQEAIAQAEHQTLFSTPAAKSHRRRRAAVIGLIAAAGFALMASAGVWFMVAGPRMPSEKMVERSKSFQGSKMETMDVDDESAPAPELVLNPMATASAAGSAPIAAVPSPATDDPAAMAGLPRWMNLTSETKSLKSIDSWTDEILSKDSREMAEVQDAAALADAVRARVEAGGSRVLSLQEAAALSLEGQARLVVPRNSFELLQKRQEIMASREELTAIRERGSDGVGASLLITALLDPALSGLQDELLREQRRYSVGGIEPARFEYVPKDDASALPSTLLDDVLWWSQDASSWMKRVSVRIELVARSQETERSSDGPASR